MSYDEREAVYQMDVNMGLEDNSLPGFPPPGEEGFDLSHAGGEHAVYEDFARDLSDLTGIHRIDDRGRQDCVEIRTSQWKDQLPALTEAYLRYRMGEPNQLPLRPSADTHPPVGNVISVEVIDLFVLMQHSFEVLPSDVHINTVLLRHGYLGCAPVTPTVAVSLRTLDAYRQIHQVSPHFGVQGLVKVVCHLHSVPYRTHLEEQIVIAYDAYLELMYLISASLNAALGRDSPNWRLLNVCPPCFYQLEQDPDFRFSFLCEMDGNNSLKRTKGIIRGVDERLDQQKARSDYWIKPEDVDQFKDEVQAQTTDNIQSSGDPEDIAEATAVSKCMQRWRNASPNSQKRMFEVFDETGIFLAACRHGFILLMCDMIQSGELSKYPLDIRKTPKSSFELNYGNLT